MQIRFWQYYMINEIPGTHISGVSRKDSYTGSWEKACGIKQKFQARRSIVFPAADPNPLVVGRMPVAAVNTVISSCFWEEQYKSTGKASDSW